MGKRTRVPETPWGRVTERYKVAGKVQIHAGGKRSAYTLSQELLGTRVPSSSYPVFLFEKFIWFKLRAVKEGIPYELATSNKFLETFMESEFEEKNFLCEPYLHDLAYPLDRHSNPIPFSGDVQLRDFCSISNHVQWERSFQNFSHNESHSNLWIQNEHQNPHLLLARHQNVLSCPLQTQRIMELQEKVISTCIN